MLTSVGKSAVPISRQIVLPMSWTLTCSGQTPQRTHTYTYVRTYGCYFLILCCKQEVCWHIKLAPIPGSNNIHSNDSPPAAHVRSTCVCVYVCICVCSWRGNLITGNYDEPTLSLKFGGIISFIDLI